MSLLDRFERKFSRFGIPHLTLLLVAAQSSTFILELAQPGLSKTMYLVPALVLEGEIWRLFSFMLTPPSTDWLWGIFALYLLYLFGTALEAHWGTFRYTLYVGIAAVMTLAVSWLTPNAAFGVAFIDISIFLAFAFLFPDYELLIFFVLPVKVKYLAWLSWAFVAFQVLAGDAHTRLKALASVTNFGLFFGREIALGVRTRKVEAKPQATKAATSARALHQCASCGATEHSQPQENWRVCSSCSGGKEYCSQHIRDHEHE